VYCDASKMGLGGVLVQNLQVVAYASRQFMTISHTLFLESLLIRF